MSLFLLFLGVSFVGGALMWTKPSKQRNILIVGFCLFITFVYFFFDKI